MEHVTIMSPEAITRGLMWPPVVVGILAILILISFYVKSLIKKDLEIAVKGFLVTMCMMLVMLLTMFVCNVFFPVETGQYKYEGTLDPDMTIVEFEEFQQQYSNVRFEDGVWKWEDKE